MKTYIRDGYPCNHPGCLSHISHPCEGCGRIGGKPVAEVVTPKGEMDELKSSVTLHYRTLALMNEALEATRDSKQSSAYRVAEFVCRTTPPVPPETETPKCKFCGDSDRPLDKQGYCKACVDGMERTNGD